MLVRYESLKQLKENNELYSAEDKLSTTAQKCSC